MTGSTFSHKHKNNTVHVYFFFLHYFQNLYLLLFITNIEFCSRRHFALKECIYYGDFCSYFCHGNILALFLLSKLAKIVQILETYSIWDGLNIYSLLTIIFNISTDSHLALFFMQCIFLVCYHHALNHFSTSAT